MQVGDPFQAFLSILLAMLRGHVEVPKYEDECRTLLGTYSYKLFTLDKLIPRFIKETNSLIQSEQWQTMKKVPQHLPATQYNREILIPKLLLYNSKITWHEPQYVIKQYQIARNSACDQTILTFRFDFNNCYPHA